MNEKPGAKRSRLLRFGARLGHEKCCVNFAFDLLNQKKVDNAMLDKLCKSTPMRREGMVREYIAWAKTKAGSGMIHTAETHNQFVHGVFGSVPPAVLARWAYSVGDQVQIPKVQALTLKCITACANEGSFEGKSVLMEWKAFPPGGMSSDTPGSKQLCLEIVEAGYIKGASPCGIATCRHYLGLTLAEQSTVDRYLIRAARAGDEDAAAGVVSNVTWVPPTLLAKCIRLASNSARVDTRMSLVRHFAMSHASEENMTMAALRAFHDDVWKSFGLGGLAGRLSVGKGAVRDPVTAWAMLLLDYLGKEERAIHNPGGTSELDGSGNFK
jgi:hypothetical protein